MGATIELRDKVVLLVGASGGLGREIARLLDQRGARLVLAGRDETRLQALGISGPVVAMDIRKPEDCARAVETTIQHYGRLEGIVNAAGVVAFGPLAETPHEVIEEIVATNLRGPLSLLHEALPRMDHGFVLQLSGLVAELPTAGISTYSAAKGGLRAAGAALGRELRRRGVIMIDARPPHTETGLADRALHGEPPKMRPGLDPGFVAQRLVEAIEAGKREVPSQDFKD